MWMIISLSTTSENVTALPCEMQTSFIWLKYNLHYQAKSVDSTLILVTCNKIFRLLQIKICYSLVISHVIKTLTAYVHFITSAWVMFKVSLQLLTQAQRCVRHCFTAVSMIRWSTESHAVKAHRRLYKFLILCCNIYSGFCVPKIIIIIITLITCKLPLRVSPGSVATFYRCGEQCYCHLFPFFRTVHTKIY